MRTVLGARREVYRVYEEDEFVAADLPWSEDVRGPRAGGAGRAAALVSLSLAAASVFAVLQISQSVTGGGQSKRSRPRRLASEVAAVERAQAQRPSARSRVDAERKQAHPMATAASRGVERGGRAVAAAVRAGRSARAERGVSAAAERASGQAAAMRVVAVELPRAARPRSEFGFEQ